MRWIPPALITVTVLLAGCADSHKLVRPVESSGFSLDASDQIYVAVQNDGSYGTETYPGSGLTTAQIIQSAFLHHSDRARSGRAIQSFDEAVKVSKDNGSDYLVFSTILHWEDRATEWSGIPDRVEVKIEIVEPEEESTITSAVIKGKSGLATFGGDHPQDLLPRPVEEFVSSLY